MTELQIQSNTVNTGRNKLCYSETPLRVQQNENHGARLCFLNVHTTFTEPLETAGSQGFQRGETATLNVLIGNKHNNRDF